MVYRRPPLRHLLAFSLSSAFVFMIFHYPKDVYLDHSLNRCSPAVKVAFMKTHKCASSTLENILFRHAHREQLNVAVPKVGNYLSRDKLFNRSVLSDTPWAGLETDVFTLHNRWNYGEVMALMGPQTPTFTVLRDPVDLFESLFSYMRMGKTYNVDIKGFVQLLRGNNQSAIEKKRHLGRFGRNQIAWDLGVDPSDFDDDDAIRRHIERIANEFQLVMISERMDESLVLLSHLLCWPLEHVTHLDLNMRKPQQTVRLDEEERRLLAIWLNVDTRIYEHFRQIFNEKVSQMSGMEEQVRQLRVLNRQLYDRCVIKHVGNEQLSGKFLETHNGTMGYLVNQTVAGCDLYAMSEPAYLSYFRQEMTRRARDKADAHLSKRISQSLS